MKAFHSIAVITILISTTFSQQNKDDWPNLNRYQSDNENVKKGKKKSPRVVFIGNSITEGWGWHYPEIFNKNRNYINRF